MLTRPRLLAYVSSALAILLLSLHGIRAVHWDERPWLHVPVYIAVAVLFVLSIFLTSRGDARAAEQIAANKIAEKERELELARAQAKEAESVLDAERTTYKELARALDVFQQSRFRLLRHLEHASTLADAMRDWENRCDTSLGAIARLWRTLYFEGNVRVRVRATLFHIEGDMVVPLRRSDGDKEGDPAQTAWRRGEGVAGRVADVRGPALIPNVGREATKAQMGCRDALFVIHRAEHRQIQSIYCLPLGARGENLAGVLCIDADRPLPEHAWQRTPDPNHASVPVHIFTGEFLSLLELRTYIQQRHASR